MTKHISQECHVRAIAVVHALIAVPVMVGAFVWVATSHGHGVAAAGVLLIAGVEILGAALFMGIAWLLWNYHPIARGVTGLLFGGAAAACICFFAIVAYSSIMDPRPLQGNAERIRDLFRFSTLILIVAWSAIVLVALFRPVARPIFSNEFRKTLRQGRAIDIPFYSSPYLVIGLVVWLTIGGVILRELTS
jgi:hypothetical protein